VLGPHVETDGLARHVVIRAFRPHAAQVAVLRGPDEAQPGVPMTRHASGVFEARFEGESEIFRYRLRITWDNGTETTLDDPYRFWQVMGEVDLHLLGEGKHHRSFEKLGAHEMVLDDVAGTYFAVWAPNAERVSVVGDFNEWDGRAHPMRHLLPSGFWEIFLPGVGRGARYKYEIRSRRGGTVFLKADPYARYAELPPNTASVVWDAGEYSWGDGTWMQERLGNGEWLTQHMAVYEVHLGSWMRLPEEGNRSLTYRELASRLVTYVKEMGYTHIELMPVLEHPYDGSWGYQVLGFFAPTSRFGPPEDFKYFVDACHREGIGVLLDWVPGHFPRDAHGLARFDGTALYEHEDPRQGEQQDWGTLIFNYGRNEVRNFLLSSALFWLEEFHLDGLRVDAVASMLYLDYSREGGEWIPNKYGGRENIEAVDFLRTLNELTHAKHPGSITVAEESTSWPGVSRPTYVGGLGFTYKWNMGWMHDTLDYMQKDPIHRRYHHDRVTFSMLYAYTENFVLPFSHDEVVHGKASMAGKMPGDDWQKAANLRALYAYMYAHPGKKLHFMGSEFGQWREWSEKAGLPWECVTHQPHQGIQQLVRDLNALYARERALYDLDADPAGFQWIDCHDNENSVFSLVRRGRDPHDFLVFIVNFTPIPRQAYRIGVPESGRYLELVNTDAGIYGGTNLGNGGAVSTDPFPSHGWHQSVALVLPPLSALFLKPDRSA
jgi:1,4-alpha-glucan branching enzyme